MDRKTSRHMLEKSTSLHLRASRSLRRSPVVTASSTIKRKLDFSCCKRLRISCGSRLRSLVTPRTLTDEGNWISSLTQPFITNCMIEQHAEQISDLRLRCVG